MGVIQAIGAPLYLEPNLGQTDARVQFLARGGGMNLFLTGADAVVGLQGGTSLRMRMVGARRGVRGEGLEPLDGTSNYLRGRDPSRWRTGVPHFAKVRYREVLPGIDLVYHGTQGELEYDFVVAPGADPGRVRLRFVGAAGMRVDDEGNLVLKTRAGEVRQKKPVVYQLTRDGQRAPVPGSYVLLGRNVAGFRIAPYDRHRALVIDPVLDYSSTLGGGYGSETTSGVAVDPGGNAYVTGSTRATDFPVTTGAYQTKNRNGGNENNFDAFIYKMDASGGLAWATYLGGDDDDRSDAIAVDTAGNVYVAGETYSASFPVTPGGYQTVKSGSSDAFVAKLNPAGTALLYATFLGGGSPEQVNGIAVDLSGNAFVTGKTISTNFPVTSGAVQRVAGGGGPYNTDAFVAKLNSGGATLGYCTYLGGGYNDEGFDIAVDSSGNAYVAGWTAGGFPTTAGALQTRAQGQNDAFVAKLNPTGATLLYSTYLGGSAYDVAYGIAVDAAGNAHVTGFAGSKDFPTAAPYQGSLKGSEDAFVAKLNAFGSALVYSTYLGGDGSESRPDIALDAAGNAVVVGTTDSENFPVVAAFQPKLAKGSFSKDAFVTRISSDGTALTFSSYLGGRSLDAAAGVAVGSDGMIYVAGNTLSDNFPRVDPARPRLPDGREYDSFIVRIDLALPGKVTAAGIVNAASYGGGPIAPGELISLFVAGSGVGPEEGAGAVLDASGRVSTTLSGTQVLFDGVAAPLFYVRRDQVNAQVPYSVAGKKTVRVQIMYQGRPTNEVEIPVADAAPGLFTLSGGKGQTIAVNPDGSLNTRSNPLGPGSVAVLYATGEGLTNPPSVEGKPAAAPLPEPRLPVSLTVGGTPAEIQYAGSAPGFAGLMQINARIPEQTAPKGGADLVLKIGSLQSQAELTMAVGEPFRISNLTGVTGTNSGSSAKVSLSLDFNDPSGSATRDSLYYSININDGEMFATGWVTPGGISPGQNSGTMKLDFTFSFMKFSTGKQAPFRIRLRNELGIESNEITGTIQT
jgi:uncharacterized protein (TIGR03437 family)